MFPFDFALYLLLGFAVGILALVAGRTKTPFGIVMLAVGWPLLVTDNDENLMLPDWLTQASTFLLIGLIIAFAIVLTFRRLRSLRRTAMLPM